LSVVLLE